MTDVSARLRAARERAGMEIEELAAITKIKPAFLEAIDRGEFERLPGEFFTRTFLRTYAREVGLPPDDVVRAYEGSVATEADPREQVHPLVVEKPRFDRGPSALRLFQAWPIVAVALVLIVALSLRGGPVESQPGESVVGTSGYVEAPHAPEVVHATATQAVEGLEKLIVDIRPSALVWVQADADGQRIIYRLMEPGEHVRLEARESLSFRIGDAGAFSYSVNGAQGVPVGTAGEVRAFRITRENYQSFVPAQPEAASR